VTAVSARIRASSFDVKPTGTNEGDRGPDSGSCHSIQGSAFPWVSLRCLGVNGVSSIPRTGQLAALDVAGDSPIFDLRRRQRMKARIPVTSNRAVTAPATGFATDAACGHSGDAFPGVVLVVLICTGILHKKPISHGKRDKLKTHFRANGANIAPCAGLTRKTVTLVPTPD